MTKAPNTAPQPEHAEQDELRDWGRHLRMTGHHITAVANRQTPLKADMLNPGSGEPNEVYWSGTDGNYRMLHVFRGASSHVEIDYYPPSPDPDDMTQDPHKDEPIIRFTATIPVDHAEPDERRYSFTLEYEYGADASPQAVQPDVQLDETQIDVDGYRQLSAFLRQVDQALPDRPDASTPSTRHTRGVISSEHRLPNADVYTLVESPTADATGKELREQQETATFTEELEIARAAAAELLRHGVELGTDPTRQEQPGIEAQYQRMQTELAAIHERNTRNAGRRGKPSGAAGRKSSGELESAEELAQRHLREAPASLSFPEVKISPEGLTEIPEDHHMVFITDRPLTALGRERYTSRNTIVAMAGPGTVFTAPFFGWKNAQYHVDPADRDVTFEQPTSGVSAASTRAKIRTGLREQQGDMYIDRILLVGPGDNIVMTRQNHTRAVEHLVSNVGGRVYIDGKPVSGRQVSKLQKRLSRLAGESGEDLVKTT